MTDQPSGDRTRIATLLPARGVPLPDHIRTFLDDLRFATISTIDPDGTPRQAVVWYTVEGDQIVINSAIGRRWPANLVRDPRLSLSVVDVVDGYRWVGLTGTVEPDTERERTQADIAGMARRYHADEPGEAERLISERFERQDRISFRFRASSIFDHLDS